MKRSPLRSVGRKRRSKQAQRRVVVAAVHARDQACVLRWDVGHRGSLHANTVMPMLCGGPLDVHEIIPRSVWPDGELVESNCVLACRIHHMWIDDNPADAHRLGLHGFSWERT